LPASFPSLRAEDMDLHDDTIDDSARRYDHHRPRGSGRCLLLLTIVPVADFSSQKVPSLAEDFMWKVMNADSCRSWC